MRFKEFLEARQFDEEPFKYTPEQLKALPAPSPDNIEDSYMCNGVPFSNPKGMGSTPMGQNVVYEGFVAYIAPTIFLKMATQADRSEDLQRIKKYVEAGCPIATPWIEFKINPGFDDGDELEITISGHEGRARAGAYGLLADNKPFPVGFFPRGGLKARDLNEKFFDQLRKNMIKCQGGNYLYPVGKIGKIYWQGKEL
jgi:hypothetical protein